MYRCLALVIIKNYRILCEINLYDYQRHLYLVQCESCVFVEDPDQHLSTLHHLLYNDELIP